MTPSQNCFDFIANEEGCILHPYLDTARVPTIGYGTIMYPNGKRVTLNDPAITPAKAQEYLAWEVNLKSKTVDALLKNVKLTQNQFDSLVSFSYNEGSGALQTSSLLKTIRANPNEAKTIATESMQDAKVKAWFELQHIRAIPLITYYFCLWCEITKNGNKVFNESLIGRRVREASLYQRK